MWDIGKAIVWREVFKNRIWRVISTIVIKDDSHETVLALLPGAECLVEETYFKGKKDGNRRWDFIDKNWNLVPFNWHTNRVLIILQPQKYYATWYLWENTSNKFLGYYINFQLPFERNNDCLDALDLDIDLVINSDFSFEWKDLDDYSKAITSGLILPEWVPEIESAKKDALEILEQRKYPLNNFWLNWEPDAKWTAPKLPEYWHKV